MVKQVSERRVVIPLHNLGLAVAGVDWHSGAPAHRLRLHSLSCLSSIMGREI